MAATAYVLGDNSAIRSIEISHAVKFGSAPKEMVTLLAANGSTAAVFSVANILGVVMEGG